MRSVVRKLRDPGAFKKKLPIDQCRRTSVDARLYY